MELTTAHAARERQFSSLHAELCSAYATLQSAYKVQISVTTEFKQKANYWETQFKKLKLRDVELNEELEALKAKLRKREQQLFGRSSEKSTSKSDAAPNATEGSKPLKKKRGQQPGSQGHGRRNYGALPEVIENHERPEAATLCACCGLAYEDTCITEDSTILEIVDVKAYRRTIRRKKYRRACTCKASPILQDAPVAPRVIKKSKIGISLWSYFLLQKYEYQQPLNRTLQQLSAQGLSLAAGTITDGFSRLLPLLSPVYDKIVDRSVGADHWHADETRWQVFEAIEGKHSQRWYLWIFHNHETVAFKICPSRSSQELIDHFGDEHPGGTLNVDRYSAYKAIAKAGLFILAFCWAHVRRDFLQHCKGYPTQETWALEWVDRIAKLYHINNQRILHKVTSKQFRQHDVSLKKAVKAIRKQMNKELKDEMILPSAKKLLKSLNNHWDGLTVFVDRPEIPMDNNTAERGLRTSILGRNAYYGSGSVWSSELAATMFTIFKTLKLWGVNCHTWINAYLQACAMHDGSNPSNIDKFLPWNMNEKQKKLFSQPPEYESTA